MNIHQCDANLYLPPYNVHITSTTNTTNKSTHTTHMPSSSVSTPAPTVHIVQPYNNQSLEYIARSLLAGGVAGSVAKTVIAPLDRVKILFQGRNPYFTQYVGSWTGSIRAVGYIWNTEGIRGLYKGHSATLVRIFPYAALNYMCFEQYKRILITDNTNTNTHLQRLLAGSLAGATSVFFTYPLDYVHSRMTYQVKLNKYQSITQTINETMRNEGGVRALYRGFIPTLLGIVPYAGVSFYTYDTLKSTWLAYKIKQYKLHYNDSRQHTTPELGIIERFLCGATAGLSAQTASYPLDVVRRRMQLKGLTADSISYKSTLQGLRSILRTDGIRGMYIGLSINYIKAGPTHAVSFLTYEIMKQKLGIAEQVSTK